MGTLYLSIADDFSKYPAGRKRRDGPDNAERFRDDVLVPALRQAIAASSVLWVKLDDVYGYSSSFLEETFGGLVRGRVFTPEQIERHLKIVAQNPIYESARLDAEKYLAEELRRVPA